MKNPRLALVTCSGDERGVIVPFVGADVAAHVRWMRLRGLSQNTVKLRRTVLGILVRETGKPLLDISADDLDTWQDRISLLADETRAAYISAARVYYQWAQTAGLRADDPSTVLVSPKVSRGLPRPVTERELEIALTAPMPLRLWFELAGFGGLRADEIAQLATEDVGADEGGRPALIVHGKGGKTRMVPLAPRPEASLHQYGLPRQGRIFRGRGDRPITAKAVSERANRWLHRHGISNTLHGFRHRFATALYESSGHDLRLVQETLGHQSPSTTAIYTRVNMHAGAAAVAAIDRPLLRPARETGT